MSISTWIVHIPCSKKYTLKHLIGQERLGNIRQRMPMLLHLEHTVNLHSRLWYLHLWFSIICKMLKKCSMTIHIFWGELANLQQLVEELQLSTLSWQISVDSIAKSCVYHSLIPKPRLISRSVIYSSPNLALKFWTSPVETWFLELAINWCPFQSFSSHRCIHKYICLNMYIHIYVSIYINLYHHITILLSTHLLFKESLHLFLCALGSSRSRESSCGLPYVFSTGTKRWHQQEKLGNQPGAFESPAGMRK